MATLEKGLLNDKERQVLRKKKPSNAEVSYIVNRLSSKFFNLDKIIANFSYDANLLLAGYPEVNPKVKSDNSKLLQQTNKIKKSFAVEFATLFLRWDLDLKLKENSLKDFEIKVHNIASDANWIIGGLIERSVKLDLQKIQQIFSGNRYRKEKRFIQSLYEMMNKSRNMVPVEIKHVFFEISENKIRAFYHEKSGKYFKQREMVVKKFPSIKKTKSLDALLNNCIKFGMLYVHDPAKTKNNAPISYPAVVSLTFWGLLYGASLNKNDLDDFLLWFIETELTPWRYFEERQRHPQSFPLDKLGNPQ